MNKNIYEVLLTEKEKKEKLVKDLEYEILELYFYKSVNKFLNPIIRIEELTEFLEQNYPNVKLIGILKELKFIKDIIINSSLENYDEVIQEIERLSIIDEELKKVLIQDIQTLKDVRIETIDNKLIVDSYNYIKERFFKNLENIYENVLENLYSQFNYSSIEEEKMSKYEQSKEDLNRQIERINYYLGMLKDNNDLILFGSSVEFKNFLDLLKTIEDPNVDVFDYIIELCKFNLDNFSKKPTKEEEEQIKENAENVHKSIENVTSDDQNPVEENIEDLLSETEKEIYEIIKEIVEKFKIGISNENLPIISDLFDDSYSLDMRKDLYIINDKIDWNFIVMDIIQNLIPNIKQNKQEVFKVFEHIVELYEKYNNLLNQYEEVLNQIQSIIAKNKKVIDDYLELADTKKEIYKSIFEKISNGEIELAEAIIKPMDSEKTVNYFGLLSTLIELKAICDQLSENISNGLLKSDDLIEIKKMFDQIFIKYEDYKKEYDLEQSTKAPINNPVPIQSKVTLPKNILYFLVDYKEYSSELRSELQQSVIKLKSRYWYDLSKDSNVLQSLWKKNETGVRKDYEITFKNGAIYIPHRIKGNSRFRTGLLKIDICKENKLKLKKRYNAPDNFNGIVLVLPSISVPGADHSSYKAVIMSFISNHMEEINSIVDLFSNPNTPAEDLYSIIDTGLEIGKKIENGGNQK